jgi:hypothetical protein
MNIKANVKVMNDVALSTKGATLERNITHVGTGGSFLTIKVNNVEIQLLASEVSEFLRRTN